MTLASWEDVVACVTEAFSVVIRGDDWLGLVHDEPGSAPGQKVKVARLSALGQPYVTITGDVFDRGAIDPWVILAVNHALPIGAVELEDARILLRATVPLVGLDPVTLRRIVLHVARQSAHMRKMGVAVADPTPFAYLAE